MSKYRLERVCGFARFMEVAPAWEALWRVHRASVFQSHAWIKACVMVTVDDHKLNIGLLWEGAVLLAVVPLAIHRRAGLRLLEWAGQDLTDHCDVLGLSSHVAMCWAMLLAAPGFDVIRLKNVRADGLAAGLLHRSDIAADLQEESYVLRRDPAWVDGEAWWLSLQSKHRSKWGRQRRALEASRGAIEVAFYDSTNPPDDAVIERLRVLKAEWANANRIEAPLLQTPPFMRSIVRALEVSGQLHMSVLRCGGVVAAGAVNAAFGKELQLWFSTFDPTFPNIGVLQFCETIRWAFDAGFDDVDHLRGAEGYKAQFANVGRPLLHVSVGASLKGRVVLKLRDLARRKPVEVAAREPMRA